MEEHRVRHQELHRALDELLADFILHTNRLPSRITLLEFMEWSYQQTISPTKEEEIETMLETDVVLAIETGETEEGVLSRYGLSIDRLDEIMEAHDRERCAICGSWWLALEILDGYCPECQEEML